MNSIALFLSRYTVWERLTASLLLILFVVVLKFVISRLMRPELDWRRSFHSTPAYQLLLWFAAALLVIPFAWCLIRRNQALRRATYIGNIRSRIYHLPNCEYQRKIATNFYRYPIKSNAEAVSHGFRPCYVCHPENSRHSTAGVF